jgi:hypothetical protein
LLFFYNDILWVLLKCRTFSQKILNGVPCQ